MPEADPEFADIYGIAPHLIADVHGTKRRSAVVHPRPDLITVLSRTTKVQTYVDGEALLSPIETSCGLTKPGMYTTRYQHSLPRPHFANPEHCAYLGALGPATAKDLREFWERQLGY